MKKTWLLLALCCSVATLSCHPDFCGNPDTGEYTGDNSKSPAGRSITDEPYPGTYFTFPVRQLP